LRQSLKLPFPAGVWERVPSFPGSTGECSLEAEPPVYLYLRQSLKLPFPAGVWERVQNNIDIID